VTRDDKKIQAGRASLETRPDAGQGPTIDSIIRRGKPTQRKWGRLRKKGQTLTNVRGRKSKVQKEGKGIVPRSRRRAVKQRGERDSGVAGKNAPIGPTADDRQRHHGSIGISSGKKSRKGLVGAAALSQGNEKIGRGGQAKGRYKWGGEDLDVQRRKDASKGG